MINPNGGVDAVDGPQDVGVALLPGDPPAELGVVVALLAPLVAELLQGLATGTQFNRQFLLSHNQSPGPGPCHVWSFETCLNS